MSWKKLDWILEYLLLILFISTMILIALPWLSLMGEELSSVQYLWVYLFPITILLLINLPNRSKIVFLCIWFFVNLGLIYYINWSLYIFLPLYFILLFFSIRFVNYSYDGFRHFPLYQRDIFLIVVLFAITLFSQDFLFYSYTGFQVLLFFMLCFFMVFINNLRLLIRREKSTEFRSYFISAFFFIFITTAVATIIGYFPAGRSTVSFVLGKIRFIIVMVGKIFLYLIGFVVKGIINILQVIFADSFFEEIELAEESVGSVGEVEYINPDRFPGGIFSTIIQILLVVLAVYFIYRAVRGREKTETEVQQGMTEQRESVFETKKLKDSFFAFWKSFKEKVVGQKHPNYDRDDPVQIVRECYYKFLISAQSICEFKLTYTPEEYLKKIEKRFVSISESEEKELSYIKKLTELYNRARYGENISREEANAAREYQKKVCKRY